MFVENKFKSKPTAPGSVARAAGLQGRRYGLALNTQLVIVIAARRIKAGEVVPGKTQAVTVKPISEPDRSRVELRIDLPFGAVAPSGERPPTMLRLEP